MVKYLSMKTHKIAINQINNLGDIVLALGFFDGIHLGHQKIINKMLQEAKKDNMESAVLTFSKSPQDILNDLQNSNVFGISDKKRILSEMGVEHLIILDLSKEDLKNTSANDFINNYIKKLGAKKVVCGKDFRFGKGGLGKPADIYKYSQGKIQVVIEQLKTIGKNKISSTELKKHLKLNNLDKVNKILGRDFCVYGIVSHGHKVGRELGFKTANINIQDDFSILLNGVFAVKVKHDNIYYHGIANVGTRPTFKDRNQKAIEVFMFEFDDQIYNHEIKIEFIKFIRQEKTFDSPKQLSKQIQIDVNKVKKHFNLE